MSLTVGGNFAFVIGKPTSEALETSLVTPSEPVVATEPQFLLSEPQFEPNQFSFE